jgi:regulator of cell morphogenesis and NO signaling
MEHVNNNFLITDFSEHTLSQIVSADYKSAAIFEKYNLDFCCGGNKLIKDACDEKGLNSVEILEEINSKKNNDANTMNFNDWNLDFLTDYIVNNHHSYVTRMIPVITSHTQKIASVHGGNHKELIEVAKSFERIYKELKQHMMKEEQILFPFIKQLASCLIKGKSSEAPFFGTVKNPIRMMEAEHQAAGDEMYEIRNLTKNYAIPEDACETYKAAMNELKEFEEDLHKHIYLENYILFPKAVKLENELVR